MQFNRTLNLISNLSYLNSDGIEKGMSGKGGGKYFI